MPVFVCIANSANNFTFFPHNFLHPCSQHIKMEMGLIRWKRKKMLPQLLPGSHCMRNHSLIFHTYIIHDFLCLSNPPTLLTVANTTLLLIVATILYILHRGKKSTLLIFCMHVFPSCSSLEMLKVLPYWRLQAHAGSRLMCLKAIQAQGLPLLPSPLRCSQYIFQLIACFQTISPVFGVCGSFAWLELLYERKKLIQNSFLNLYLADWGFQFTFLSADRKAAWSIMHFSAV